MALTQVIFKMNMLEKEYVPVSDTTMNKKLIDSLHKEFHNAKA
jgi:hypothetical protein